ncbi:MAG: choline/ethanolamine kinase family protein [Longicatena sp.]
MEKLYFLDKLFLNSHSEMIDMKKGLTNQNYLLTLDEDVFVVRIPHYDAKNIVNRHHETLALEAIKGQNIDVETIYYDEDSGYKVTTYLPNAKTYHECNDPHKIERVGALMKRFHNLHAISDADFEPIKRYYAYHSLVKKPLYDLRSYESILEDVKAIKNKKTLCHNDWVDGNILFDDNKTYLIDYEYAANNDPLFDVMSFLSENKIYDKAERVRFYTAYFGSITPTNRYQLHIWECFHNLLWCTWAMMMWESRKESIYKDIAKDKYQALQMSFQTKDNLE